MVCRSHQDPLNPSEAILPNSKTHWRLSQVFLCTDWQSQFLKWVIQKMFIPDLRLSHVSFWKDLCWSIFMFLNLGQKGALRPSGQKLSHCFANKLCCSAVSQVWVAEQICNYLQNLAISFMPAIGYRYEISPHVCGLHVGVPFDGTPNIIGSGGQGNRDKVQILQPGGLGQDTQLDLDHVPAISYSRQEFGNVKTIRPE